MRSFRFGLGTPGVGESAIATVRLYESADGLTGWTLINSIAVGDLTTDGTKKRWDNASADLTKYARLAPVSATGVERPGGSILPPAPVDPDTFTVFCWTVDLGLGITEGIRLSATPSGKVYAKAGNKLAVKPTDARSDDTGYVALDLPADAGSVVMTIDRQSVTIDTTGKSGQSINVATLLS